MKIIYQQKTLFKYSETVFPVILITKMMAVGIMFLRVFKKLFSERYIQNTEIVQTKNEDFLYSYGIKSHTLFFVKVKGKILTINIIFDKIFAHNEYSFRGGLCTLDERGKIVFPDAEEIKKNKRFEDMKKHWESFVESENDERKKYLRTLDVQFSVNSMVKGKKTEEVTEFMTDVFAEKKADEQEKSIFEQVEEFKNHGMRRSTDNRGR